MLRFIKHPDDPFDGTVSLGKALALEDLPDHHGVAPMADDFYSTPGSTPPIYSSRQYLGTDLLSSDP
ncbi:hypothetical protein KVV02_005873, partial [Mortierella alpina]